MPVCRECGKMQSTAEVKRLPKGDFKCKDAFRCADRKAKNG